MSTSAFFVFEQIIRVKVVVKLKVHQLHNKEIHFVAKLLKIICLVHSPLSFAMVMNKITKDVRECNTKGTFLC